MRSFLFVILAMFTAGCGESRPGDDYRPSPKSVLVHAISNKVFSQLKKEKNLFPCECSGGGMMPQITLLHWGFVYYKDIDIEEARELLMTTANRFLQAFNADERIRPYLATYPFKPENIQINIFLKKPDGSELGPGVLHVASLTEGFLRYDIQDPETRLLLTEIHTETYEEAAAKLSTIVVGY